MKLDNLLNELLDPVNTTTLYSVEEKENTPPLECSGDGFVASLLAFLGLGGLMIFFSEIVALFEKFLSNLF